MLPALKDKSPTRQASIGDDLTKNLFKVCCGVLNLSLMQRGIDPLEDRLLISYLDAINYDIQDIDLMLLNQLTAIKSLVNRKAFSITNR